MLVHWVLLTGTQVSSLFSKVLFVWNHFGFPWLLVWFWNSKNKIHNIPLLQVRKNRMAVLVSMVPTFSILEVQSVSWNCKRSNIRNQKGKQALPDADHAAKESSVSTIFAQVSLSFQSCFPLQELFIEHCLIYTESGCSALAMLPLAMLPLAMLPLPALKPQKIVHADVLRYWVPVLWYRPAISLSVWCANSPAGATWVFGLRLPSLNSLLFQVVNRVGRKMKSLFSKWLWRAKGFWSKTELTELKMVPIKKKKKGMLGAQSVSASNG